MNETFICYSRRDREFVDLLVKALDQSGFDCWLDVEDIPGAAYWKQEILVGIQASHNFLYVISPDSVISVYCSAELDHALALNKRIIPLVARSIDPSDARPSIGELNWIFFDDFSAGLRQLISLLDAPLGISLGDRLDSKISVSVGDKPIKSFFLYRNKYVVGRNPSGDFANCGLIFTGKDPAVSKCHCTLVRKDNRWHLVDGLVEFNRVGNPISFKPSRNGVSVWGEPLGILQLRPLLHRDYIKLSPKTSLVYEELLAESHHNEPDDRDTQADCKLEDDR